MHHQPDGYEAWERRYLYANMPESGAAVRSNRLLATSNPGDVEGVYSARYGYADGTDASDPTNNAGLHGSMTAMPHLPSIHWDYADRMQSCTKTVGPNPDRVYFTYDASGQRVRKVYEHSSTREERIYLGGYEVYRSWSTGANASLDVHRTTLHVMDDQRRVAMVENTIEDTDEDVPAGRRWRFQLDNHLGTATLELDHEGNVISYEEYHPYGTSAVRVQRSAAGLSQKRYRYTGKERDEETGLYYHGARYYAPWLGRWTAADPLGVVQPGKSDLNPYVYVTGRVVNAGDPDGQQEREGVQSRPSVAALVVDEANKDTSLQGHKKAVSALVPEGHVVEANSDSFNASARKAAQLARKGGTVVLASGHGTDAEAAAEAVKDPESNGMVKFNLTNDISVDRLTLDGTQWGKDEKTIKDYEFYEKEDTKRDAKGEGPIWAPNRPSSSQYHAAQDRMVARQKLSALKGALKETGVAALVIAECGVGADEKLLQATADFLGVKVTASSGDLVPVLQTKSVVANGEQKEIEMGMKLRVDAPRKGEKAGKPQGYVGKGWQLPLGRTVQPKKRPGNP
jgi:RHS repeat-associated protein